jgi:hypothetical protein
MVDEYTIEEAESVSGRATEGELLREDPQLGEGLILDSFNNILNGG